MNTKIKVGTADISASVSDMTTEQYLRISEVLTRDSSSRSWAGIFIMLGAIKKEVNRMDISTELSPLVVEFVKLFNELNQVPITRGKVEINGRIYEPVRLENGDIKVSSIDEENINELVSAKSNSALATLAVLFKDTQANDEANESEAAIKHRMKVFANAPADLMIYPILEVNRRMMQIYKKSIEATNDFEESQKQREDAGN